MAHFNQCSHLVDGIEAARDAYATAIQDRVDPLQIMLDMQKSLQKKLAAEKPECNVDPDSLETAGDVLKWLRNQDDYIADETRELYTALGGMSNGEKDASAVWKPWKARHIELQNKKISELSEADQLEIKFEMIDQVHFFLNKLMALGLNSQEIFELYYLKNAENFARQDRGY